MYWLTKNSDPNMAKNTKVTAIDAAVKRGLAKKPSSRIGWSVCRSQNTNDVSDTTATTNEPITSGSVQPLAGPSMTPNRSVTNPTIDNDAPRMSKRGAC